MPHYDVNFRVIKVDEDVSEIKEYALKGNKAVNIFIEQDVDEISGLVDIPNCVTGSEVGQSSQVEVNGKGLEKEKGDNKGKGVLMCSEEDDVVQKTDNESSGSSEDEADGVYFYDSEDERALGLDDGFEPYDITPMDMNENMQMVEDGDNGSSFKPTEKKVAKSNKKTKG